MKSQHLRKGSWGCALLITLALLASDGRVLAVDEDTLTVSPPTATSEEDVLLSHARILNELSSRRRLNTLFPNEQAAFHGMPIRYVNSSRGNLTFVRRDLVTVGRIPIVLARVYDSSRDDDSDFGRGWHLSLAETIRQRSDGTLNYVDDSASELSFVSDGAGGYALAPGGPTDISSVDVLGDSVRLAYRNGWSKSFARFGDRFLLTSIRDPYENALALRYRGTMLVHIEARNGRFVSLVRDALGRVTGITDDQGRTVSYEYDPQGRLVAVADLGRNRWRYEYDERNRLRRALDPRNIEILAAAYDPSGRVTEGRIYAVQYQYEYRGTQTRLMDAAEQVTLVSHDRSGIATSMTNPEGFVSAVRLDPQQRIAMLLHNDRPRAAFSYGPSGRIKHLRRFDAAGSIDIDHDATGKPAALVTGAVESADTLRDSVRGPLHGNTDHEAKYEYTALGDVQSVTREGTTTLYTYNADGQIESVDGPAGAMQLAYFPDGKLASARYPDGSVHRYRYNALGLRDRLDRSDGASTAYEYDAAGNLIRIEHRMADGMRIVQTLEIDAYNRLTAQVLPDGTRMSVGYDANDNPQSVTYRGRKPETFNYQYDRNNRLIAVWKDEAIISRHRYRATEPDVRVQVDGHAGRVAANVVRQSASIADLLSVMYTRPYGSYLDAVRYDETTRTLDVPSDFSFAANDAMTANSLMRRELLEMVSGTGETITAFDHPSNVMFLPSEDDTINCVPSCTLTGVRVYGNGAIGSISVPAGTTVSFIAAKQPAGNNCQRMYYQWTSNGLPIGSGLSGLLSYRFSSVGTYQVYAEGECLGCDLFASGYIAVNVTPCDVGGPLQTQTAATTPSNRARTKLGVGEQVKLTLNPAPSCGVTWSVSGGGTLSTTTSNSTTFTAPERAASPTVKAKIAGVERLVTFSVVQPTNEVAVKVAELSYPAGQQGAGMQLQVTVKPNDVSFFNVEIKELPGPATNVTGYFTKLPPDAIDHETAPWRRLSPSNSTSDIAQIAGLPPPWSPGGFQWNIPLRWRVLGSTNEAALPNELQTFTLHDASGRTTVSKLGQSVTRSP